MPLVKPRPSRPMPIRITPLIDVVFILLVFFMLTSHLLPTRYLELDNQSQSGSGGDGEPLPALTLLASGELRWADTTLAPAQLVPRLQAAAIDEVTLETTGDTPLNAFTRTLSTLRDAGIKARWRRDPVESGAP